MTRNEAQAAIRALAKDRSRLRFTNHALERDPTAGKYPISERQAVQCLLNGFLKEGPAPDISLANGWKFTCERAAEESDIVVAGVVVPEKMLLVITGYETRPFRRRQKPKPGDDWEDEWKDVDEK